MSAGALASLLGSVRRCDSVCELDQLVVAIVLRYASDVATLRLLRVISLKRSRLVAHRYVVTSMTSERMVWLKIAFRVSTGEQAARMQALAHAWGARVRRTGEAPDDRAPRVTPASDTLRADPESPAPPTLDLDE